MDTRLLSNAEILDYLRSHDACDDAVTWVEEHGGSADELWYDCPRGDWMMWALSVRGIAETPETMALCMADILEPAASVLDGTSAVQKVLRLYSRGETDARDVEAVCGMADAAGQAAKWAAKAVISNSADMAIMTIGWMVEFVRRPVRDECAKNALEEQYLRYAANVIRRYYKVL